MNWNDNSYFHKLIPDKNCVKDENLGNYKLLIKNQKSFIRLIDYNINLKIIEPAVDFKINSQFQENKFKLEFGCILNEKIRSMLKNSQMIIVIHVKSNDYKIYKSTLENYQVEDKKITYTFNDFCLNPKYFIGMIFDTVEKDFIEVVKVMYRYMVRYKIFSKIIKKLYTFSKYF
jgi:hypothetical protein